MKLKRPPRKNKIKPKEVGKIEKSQRIAQAVEMLFEGLSKTQITEKLQSDYSVTYSTSYDYYKLAGKVLEEWSKSDRERQLGLALIRYNRIFKKLWDLEDYKGAAVIVDKIVELMGLKKINIDIKNTVVFSSQIGDDGIIRSGFLKEGEIIDINSIMTDISEEEKGIDVESIVDSSGVLEGL